MYESKSGNICCFEKCRFIWIPTGRMIHSDMSNLQELCVCTDLIVELVVGRARLRETLKQSKQMCRGFETFRHPSLRWHLVVIFTYCSETALTKKQLSELTNYNVCYSGRSPKWFGGVVSVVDWDAVSLVYGFEFWVKQSSSQNYNKQLKCVFIVLFL